MKLPNIGELKPYPEMKKSGAGWLGKVPAHWQVRKLRHTIRTVAQRNRPDLPLLSVVRERGVVVRDVSNMDANHNYIPEDLRNYKVVKRHEFAMNKMKAWQGSYGVSYSDGIVSPAYYVFGIEGVNPGYFHAAIRSKTYVPYFARASDGVRIGQWDLSIPRMREIPFFVPPVSEQTAIVRFLDHADRRIRCYIRAKAKLIRLLEEQKQAIINQAVSGKVDVRTGQPYSRYRTSRVEWLGDIPENWKVSRVKSEFRCLNHRRLPLSSTERGEMSLRRYDYYGASGVIDRVDDYLFDDELLLIAEDGANLSLRNLPLAIIARGRFWVNNHAHVLKPKRGHLEFLSGVMESLNYLPWISGAAQPKLTQDRLMSIAIAVPPREEQDKIVSFAATETSHLRVGISRAEREMNLLREYRIRLIADVVTGKVDVREAVARLPTEEEDPGPHSSPGGLSPAHIPEKAPS